jgi:hypothetical protein
MTNVSVLLMLAALQGIAVGPRDFTFGWIPNAEVSAYEVEVQTREFLGRRKISTHRVIVFGTTEITVTPEFWGTSIVRARSLVGEPSPVGNCPFEVCSKWSDWSSDSISFIRSPDVSGNGSVELQDYMILLSSWGKETSVADFDGSGWVGVSDYMALLYTWGGVIDGQAIWKHD